MQDKIWKVRTVKNYPEAHSHLIIGKVLNIETSSVRLDCKTYHFGKVVHTAKDVLVGQEMVRIIPWSRIEIINELPDDFDYVKSSVTADKTGKVVIKDGKYAIPLGSRYDKRY